MRLITTALTILFITQLALAQDEAVKVKNHLFYEGTLVDVRIDEALYQQEGSKEFIFRVDVINKADHTIGVDMSDYWGVLYPNQFVIHKVKKPTEVIEHQTEPEKLTPRLKEQLKWEFEFKKLVMIEPGESADYYRSYYQAVQKQLDPRFGEVISFSFDGQLLVTDGKTYEDINCIDEDKVNKILQVHYPVQYMPLPAGARVLVDLGE